MQDRRKRKNWEKEIETRKRNSSETEEALT